MIDGYLAGNLQNFFLEKVDIYIYLNKPFSTLHRLSLFGCRLQNEDLKSWVFSLHVMFYECDYEPVKYDKK